MDTDKMSKEINEYASESSDGDLFELLIIDMVYDYDKNFLNETKVQTSTLSSYDFVVEVLNRYETTCFDLFQMEKTCFVHVGCGPSILLVLDPQNTKPRVFSF